MTLKEIDELIDDTKRTARSNDKVALAAALGTLEVARQLSILNATLAGKESSKAAAAGRRK
jgi:hypothetical protein